MLTLFACSWLLLTEAVPPPAAPAPAMPAPFTGPRFRAHVAWLASDELEGRDVGSAGAAKAMQYLVRHFKEAGLKGLGSQEEWYQDFPYGSQKKVTARNVLAVFPGQGPLAKEAIIVSTHHDHLGIDPAVVKAGKDGIFNGADDNASGCAALLLLVQALSAERPRLPTSYRTVIIASFDAEERGLVGSRHYVRHPLWPLNKTTANINFSMVGRLFRGKVLAADSESSAYLAERIRALAGQCGLRMTE
jgi:aminopeptidase N